MPASTSTPSHLELAAEELENCLLALEDRVERIEEELGLPVADMEAWYAARREEDN